MSKIDIIGTLAGSCTSFAVLPEVIKLWRTGDIRIVSLPLYAILAAGSILWVIYGAIIGAKPIMIFSSITLGLASSVLFKILSFHYRNSGH
jgi:MtN3 and saliva related transmembrane protein